MDAVKCDQCGAFAANPGRRNSLEWEGLPDGWIRLWAGNRSDRGQIPQIEGEFCGTKCGGKYLTAYVPVLIPKERAG